MISISSSFPAILKYVVCFFQGHVHTCSVTFPLPERDLSAFIRLVFSDQVNPCVIFWSLSWTSIPCFQIILSKTMEKSASNSCRSLSSAHLPPWMEYVERCRWMQLKEVQDVLGSVGASWRGSKHGGRKTSWHVSPGLFKRPGWMIKH